MNETLGVVVLRHELEQIAWCHLKSADSRTLLSEFLISSNSSSNPAICLFGPMLMTLGVGTRAPSAHSSGDVHSGPLCAEIEACQPLAGRSARTCTPAVRLSTRDTPDRYVHNRSLTNTTNGSIVQNTATGIPKCCVSTRTEIPVKLMRRVYKYEDQHSNGACDINALILHVKRLHKPICAHPKLKGVLFRLQSRRKRSHHKDVY
ncbi:hypothetical protein WMY93_004018 [Mugilogobius chulae]|uniref:Chemokine interleukin-8-like domain-containing protein n=1 Tax=Mugilogobius chulae TaxID=88201 RepID=A0AAW0PMM9_9GOBI